MNRLQKKCFIASAGFHVLLALVLFVGPGFLSKPPKTEDVPVLDFIPVKTVDDMISGGGNPNAKPPAALPVPPQAQPPPQPQPAAQKPLPEPEPDPQPTPEPAPSKRTVPDFKDTDGTEPTKRPKPRKIEPNLTPITHKRDPSAADKRAKEEAQAQAKAADDARRRLARQIGQVVDKIGNEVSGGTSIEPFKGPGGGGLPYANWKSAIKTIYERAWLLPDGVVDDDAATLASVTIARDGTVLRSSISRFSNDPVVDRSVQAALDRVSKASPLPDTSTEPSRTITIRFSVKAKRALG
jgi:TonB family protein